MAYADLHIHSNFSYDGTADVKTILEKTRLNTSLSIIAITDHDEIEGAMIAAEIAPSYGLEVVVGSEVSTAEGHLLALFIQDRVPSGLSLIDTLFHVESLGGLCIAPHPSARFTSSLSLEKIEKALELPIGQRVLAGIEVFNAGIFRSRSNGKAMNFALNHDIALCANSDAHVTSMIGKAATCFEGNTSGDLYRALVNKETHIFRSYSVSSCQIATSWLHDKFIFQLKKSHSFASAS